MRALLLLFASFWESTVAFGAGIKLESSRCAEAKEQNPALLAVVVVVSSSATEFGIRSQLRKTQFRDAHLLISRAVFRGSSNRQDKRPVCVDHIFILSPWTDLRNIDNGQHQVVRQDEWNKIIAESEEHRDILISPTIVDARTRARELMQVLEWSRQTAPWADYTVSTDTSVHLRWPQMIEVFPPPVPRDHLAYMLWQLGSDNPTIDALFFKDPRVDTWRKCADVKVAAFSRDLVHQITGIAVGQQIVYALRRPLRMYRARCKLGAFLCNSACRGDLGVLYNCYC